MKRMLGALLFALALAVTPACISLPDAASPIAASQTLEQRAYALVLAYAAALEEGADIAADPATPPAFRRALGEAERAAAPVVTALQAALLAYLRARAAANDAGDQTPTLAAMAELDGAVAAAEGPLQRFEKLLLERR